MSTTLPGNGTGTDQGDTLYGSLAAQIIHGLRGDDLIAGAGQDAATLAGAGNDTLLGQMARTRWKAAPASICWWVARGRIGWSDGTAMTA
jgi:hypothetical protein